MTPDLTRIIDDVLDSERPCACGRTHRVTTRVVRFDDHAGSAVAEFLRSLGVAHPTFLVCDDRTHAIADAVAATLRSAGLMVTIYVFSVPGPGSLVADETAAGELDGAVRAARPACLVGIGSGTLNDLCKTVATLHDLPYVACPTAASMNGYTSTVASLKRDGLKVTDPVTAPVAVIVDLAAVSAAPPLMTAAGVADLLSKFVTTADWTLAHVIEGGYYCEYPAALAARAADAVVDRLDAVAVRAENGLHVLSAALVLSGLSMAAAGSSAPASGAEHLISHYWDMCVPDPAGVRLHGTQVGVGTLITATLYETLRRVDPATIDPDAAADQVPGWDTLERELRTHFASAAPAVVEQARRKHHTRDAVRKRADDVACRWADIWSTLDPLVKPASQIKDLLRRVGAPTTLAQLGLDAADAINALRWSRHIRARYTVFDFAADVGLFDADRRLELLHRSGVLETPGV